MLNKYGTSRYLGDLISDPNKLRQAQNQLESCFNRGNQHCIHILLLLLFNYIERNI